MQWQFEWASEACSRDLAPKSKFPSGGANKARKRPGPHTFCLLDSLDDNADPDFRPYKRIMPAQAGTKEK